MRSCQQVAARLLLFIKFGPLVNHCESTSANKSLLGVHSKCISSQHPQLFKNVDLGTSSQTHKKYWESVFSTRSLGDFSFSSAPPPFSFFFLTKKFEKLSSTLGQCFLNIPDKNYQNNTNKFSAHPRPLEAVYKEGIPISKGRVPRVILIQKIQKQRQVALIGEYPIIGEII